MLRVVDSLALLAAVYNCLAPATILKLDLASRLIQLVELAGGVGASYKLPGQLHVHTVVQGQGKLRYSHAVLEPGLDKEVYERALASRLSNNECRSIHATR